MNLYPLKFTPIFKERLWGGTKLNEELRKNIEGDFIGESWELSGVEGSISKVANGKLKGISLNELLETYEAILLGKKVFNTYGTSFPILIKFLDAKKDLSIQLHPNDALAKERHNSLGKTEMWHVLQADDEANLIIGFNKDVSRQEYEDRLKNDELEQILNYEKVSKGDTFFIKTGKVHAIGAGVLLAEIQQTSDITYRIYDWNRKDQDGNTRELHTELALDAIDYKQKDDFKVNYPKAANKINEMVQSPYFITNYLNIDTSCTLDTDQLDSFSIYICVDGAATITNDFGSATLKKGETALIGANSTKVTFEAEKAEILQVYM